MLVDIEFVLTNLQWRWIATLLYLQVFPLDKYLEIEWFKDFWYIAKSFPAGPISVYYILFLCDINTYFYEPLVILSSIILRGTLLTGE